MKKILCAVLLFVCVVVCGFAQQTILYGSTHSYKNGVKVKFKKPRFMYITFMDNYSRFYVSDEYGDATSANPTVYKYFKTESDYNVYQDEDIMTRWFMQPNLKVLFSSPVYKFAKDLSVMNLKPLDDIIFELDGISIYKRMTKAEKEAILREHEESLPKLLR